jgi:fructokinase
MGEALIDIIIDADGELTSVIGGGELNTARAAARLGAPVAFLGGISQDSLGHRIRRAIEADGMALALAEGVPEPTTLAIAQIAADGSATYRFLLDDTSVGAVTPQMALAAMPANCDFLHVGGIGLTLAPFAHAAVAVVEASPTDRIVMLDPNFRPAIAGESTLFRSSIEALLPRTDILKASTEDLGFMFPDRAPIHTAQALQDQYGCVVLMTDGHGDVWVIAADGSERCVVPRVDVVDTVGAGDAFGGGFAAWWSLGGYSRDDLCDIAALVRAAEAGITVAAVNCQRAGANPPRRRELPADWDVR